MTLNEVFVALIVILTMAAFIVDFATKGRYRSRTLVLVLLTIGLVVGVIYVHSGVRNGLFFPLLFTGCLIGTVTQFAVKRKFRSRTQAVIVIVALVIWSIYIVAAICGLA